MQCVFLCFCYGQLRTRAVCLNFTHSVDSSGALVSGRFESWQLADLAS